MKEVQVNRGDNSRVFKPVMKLETAKTSPAARPRKLEEKGNEQDAFGWTWWFASKVGTYRSWSFADWRMRLRTAKRGPDRALCGANAGALSLSRCAPAAKMQGAGARLGIDLADHARLHGSLPL
jgi:hypothetical protein